MPHVHADGRVPHAPGGQRAQAEGGAEVTILCKQYISDCNTGLAQGGIASAVAPDDSPMQHAQDTLLAGAGLCDATAVEVLVQAGPQRIADLDALGTPFDREDGSWSLTREGAHSISRILHVADATGEAITSSSRSR